MFKKKKENNCLFLHTLDLWVFFWLFLVGRKKYQNIYCVYIGINKRLLKLLDSQFNIKLVDDYENLPTTSALQFQKDFVAYIEELIKDSSLQEELIPILNKFDLATDSLIIFLKKYAATHLFQDASLIWRAQFHKDICSNIYILVYHKKLLIKMAGPKQRIIGFLHPSRKVINCLKLFFNLWRCLKLFLRFPPQKGLESGTKYKFIFEQTYKTLENPDFKAFYNYFNNRDDVLYLCSDRESDIFQFLKQEGKPVCLLNEYPLDAVSRKKQFLFFLGLFPGIFTINGNLSISIFRTSIIRIYYYRLLYGGLFDRFKPVFFLKPSSTYLTYHPLITAICNRYDVRHIGYMHSQYTYFRSIFALIDFHYFGLLGVRFRDRYYAEYWPETIKYKLLGPQCNEASTGKDSFIDKSRLTVGVMARQIQKPLGEYSYSEFIAIIWTTLANLKIPNLHVIFKEWKRQEWAERIIKNLNDQSPISCENAYHNSSDEKLRTYAGEVMTRSDIVIISSPGYSSTAFEAIGKKKKLVILLTKDIPPHPFEAYPLPLVAKSQSELDNSLRWLMNIQQDEYERLIDPIINDWSKVADGNLVRDFITSIEKECSEEDSHVKIIGDNL